jgi:hypothetical protein
MFADQIDDAPAAIPLLEVDERKYRDLATSESATEKHSDDGPVRNPDTNAYAP